MTRVFLYFGKIYYVLLTVDDTNFNMGLLSEGSPLSWEETRDLADHVREHGITQFINLYHKLKDRQGDFLKWGDEVSDHILEFIDGQIRKSITCTLKYVSGQSINKKGNWVSY